MEINLTVGILVSWTSIFIRSCVVNYFEKVDLADSLFLRSLYRPKTYLDTVRRW
jgi:hypothetical protein